ncbi:hypothetical protein [Streptomyces beijiangensis]|uniref:Uncharacterized protein n=1 Tax=Streptomyces beijiangensis TaxID=163361 RepID=A0A939JI11_9ACTN|nr:hypothetical protein [Streptomyces beijiangensis]MBO0516811.1 hypothetical protein [Streptomyces beijiangensis]
MTRPSHCFAGFGPLRRTPSVVMQSDPEALDLLDACVEIPMIGTGASLNVAVVDSLALYKLAGLLRSPAD